MNIIPLLIILATVVLLFWVTFSRIDRIRKITESTNKHIQALLKINSIKMEMDNISKESSEKLEELELSNIFFTNANEAIVVADADKNIIRVNPAFSQITGYSFEDVKGLPLKTITSGAEDDSYYDVIWDELTQNKTINKQLINRTKKGEIYPAKYNLSAVYNADEELNYVVVLISDITKEKEKEKELIKMAKEDALTKLPNKVAFYDRLEMAIEYSKRSSTKFALMFIDLDEFKPVNDNYGHQAGDKLLIETGVRLKESVRGSDSVCRIAGDEFTAIIPNIKNPTDAALIAEKMINNLIEPCIIDGNNITIKASIGITVYPDDMKLIEDKSMNESDSLTHLADEAMYFAKNAGKNQYKFRNDE